MCENVNIFQYHSSIYFTAFMLFVAVYIQLYFSGNFKGWRQNTKFKYLFNESLHFLCRVSTSKMINGKHLRWSKLNMKIMWTCSTVLSLSMLIKLRDQTSQRRTCTPQKNIIFFFAFLLV